MVECERCLKTFNRISNLRRHQRVCKYEDTNAVFDLATKMHVIVNAKCSQLWKRASMCARHEATCDANGAHLSAFARTKLLQRFFSTTSGGDRRVNQTRPEDYLGDVGGRSDEDDLDLEQICSADGSTA